MDRIDESYIFFPITIFSKMNHIFFQITFFSNMFLFFSPQKRGSSPIITASFNPTLFFFLGGLFYVSRGAFEGSTPSVCSLVPGFA